MTLQIAILVSAVSRLDIAQYVDQLFTLYGLLILVRILMTWLQNIPYNRFLAATLDFVSSLTDPYLNLFRRMIPMARVGAVGIDLSPIIALLLLFVVQSIVVGAITPAAQ